MKKIEQLFLRYRDVNDPQKISSEGVVKLLEDLQLSPESRLVLIIAWKFRAQTQCEFSRDEFINGFCELGVDSLEKLKQKLPVLEQDLNDIHKFKDFYHFTFNYAKDTGQKGLDLDMAIAYWNIVLKDRFKFLDLWCKFLTVSWKVYKITIWVQHKFFYRRITNDPYRKIPGICSSTLHNTSTIKCQTMMQKAHGKHPIIAFVRNNPQMLIFLKACSYWRLCRVVFTTATTNHQQSTSPATTLLSTKQKQHVRITPINSEMCFTQTHQLK